MKIIKIIKKYQITNEILYESLMIAWLKGERSLVEDYNINMNQNWKDNHMTMGKHMADSIRQKLQINNNIINLNINDKCIEVFDKTIEDIIYDNNFK